MPFSRTQHSHSCKIIPSQTEDTQVPIRSASQHSITQSRTGKQHSLLPISCIPSFFSDLIYVHFSHVQIKRGWSLLQATQFQKITIKQQKSHKINNNNTIHFSELKATHHGTDSPNCKVHPHILLFSSALGIQLGRHVCVKSEYQQQLGQVFNIRPENLSLEMSN